MFGIYCFVDTVILQFCCQDWKRFFCFYCVNHLSQWERRSNWKITFRTRCDLSLHKSVYSELDRSVDNKKKPPSEGLQQDVDHWLGSEKNKKKSEFACTAWVWREEGSAMMSSADNLKHDGGSAMLWVWWGVNVCAYIKTETRVYCILQPTSYLNLRKWTVLQWQCQSPELNPAKINWNCRQQH